MVNTGFVFESEFLKHARDGHPESPGRLSSILDHLRDSGLLGKLSHVLAVPHDLGWIERTHSLEHVATVREASLHAPAFLDPDTYVTADSFDVAVLAVSAALSACDAVMDGQVRNAFCALRPPGHHAEKERSMGFCLFNNVAVAANYLRFKQGLSRILIVDWDVHHGNGTQDIFYEDPGVFYFSVHEQALYPYTGEAHERGRGRGEGTTLNVPLRIGSGDAEYVEAFQKHLKPAAAEFRPEFILVSAGFDAHVMDPLAGMRVTTEGFGQLTRIVRELAEMYSQGRMISVLEGGYDQGALARSVGRHLEEMMVERRAIAPKKEVTSMTLNGMPEIQEYMTPLPQILGGDTPASRALEIMADGLYTYLPVQDEGQVIGIVTERELRVALACSSEPDLLVRDIAIMVPYLVLPETPLDDVLSEMCDHRHGCALIQDRDGQLLGIFTETDALQAFVEFLREGPQQAVA